MRMQAMLTAMVGRVREEVTMLERRWSVDMLNTGRGRSGVVKGVYCSTPKGALRRRFERSEMADLWCREKWIFHAGCGVSRLSRLAGAETSQFQLRFLQDQSQLKGVLPLEHWGRRSRCREQKGGSCAGILRYG
jgi:hypothetical protein